MQPIGSPEKVTINPLYVLIQQKKERDKGKQKQRVKPIDSSVQQLAEQTLALSLTPTIEPVVVPKLCPPPELLVPSPPASDGSSGKLASSESIQSVTSKTLRSDSQDSLSSLTSTASTESEHSSSNQGGTRSRKKSVSGFISRFYDSPQKSSSSSSREGSYSRKSKTLTQPLIVLEPLVLQNAQECLVGNEKALSTSYLRALTAPSRVHLLKWLQEEKTNLAAQAACSRILQIQEHNQQQNLVKAIYSIDEAHLASLCPSLKTKEELASALCLSSGTILPADKLFTILFQALESPQLSLTVAQKVAIVLFSIRWSHENAGTNWLEAAIDSLTKIVLFCQSHQSDDLQTLAPKLENTLKRASKLTPLFISAYEQENNCLKSFQNILKEVLISTTRQETQNLAEKIARDLHQYQIQMYKAIRPHDFISKKLKMIPSSIARTTLFQDALSYFVADSILDQGSYAAAAKVMQFFLDVSRACYALKDFACTLAIKTGLDNAALNRLKPTWQQVRQTPMDVELLTFLDENFGFSKDYNFDSLRRLIKGLEAKETFIPYLGIIKKDLTFLNENRSTTLNQDGEPQYNFENILTIRSLILKTLSHQSSFASTLVSQAEPTVPFSDIVFQSLKNVPKNSIEDEVKREERYEKAKRFETPSL